MRTSTCAPLSMLVGWCLVAIRGKGSVSYTCRCGQHCAFGLLAAMHLYVV